MPFTFLIQDVIQGVIVIKDIAIKVVLVEKIVFHGFCFPFTVMN